MTQVQFFSDQNLLSGKNCTHVITVLTTTLPQLSYITILQDLFEFSAARPLAPNLKNIAIFQNKNSFVILETYCMFVLKKGMHVR